MPKITGERELRRRLGSIAQHPTVVEMDKIGIASLEPVRSETAALAPRASLRRGVVTRRTAANGRRRREYWVSFRRGLAMMIAHLVEFGTAPHSLAKGASRRKGLLQHVPPFHPGTHPEPFMTPAYESQKDNVLTTYGKLTWAAILTAVERARR